MPHTSHKKKTQRNKRAQVLDEDGWTRVTNTNPNSVAPRPLTVDGGSSERTSYEPSQPVEGLTIEKLQTRYEDIEKEWLASSSWQTLENILRNKIDRQLLQDIDVCVLLGSGSFCGHVKGWIERFDVSRYQLAAFVSVVNTIENVTGRRPLVTAQEPVYNPLDVQLLANLDIKAVDDPHGFESLTGHSLVYAPCAELSVELRMLASKPAIAIKTGALDSYWRNDKGEACTNRIQCETEKGSTAIHQLDDGEPTGSIRKHLKDEIERGLRIVEDFQKGRESYSIPELDVKDSPFERVQLFAAVAVNGE